MMKLVGKNQKGEKYWRNNQQTNGPPRAPLSQAGIFNREAKGGGNHWNHACRLKFEPEYFVGFIRGRQFHRFTGVFADRFLLQTGQALHHTSEGMEHLDRLLDDGSGAILLMSHVGNWEIAAHMLKRRRSHLPLLLYMGARQKEQIEKLQKEELAESGIRIIVAGESAGTPYDTVEGIQHLKNGGLISLSGDRVWHPGQRTVKVRFLGHRVSLPLGPHVFALLAGVPLLTFFSHRTGPRSHHVTVGEPRRVTPSSRGERDAALQASAQAYADRLEAHVRMHPFDWFHFRPLWGKAGDA